MIFDLAEPHTIAAALADVGPVRRLALAAIDRDQNTVDDYDIDRAIRLVTLKLVGYTAVVVRRSASGCRRRRRSCCSAAWPRSGRTRDRRRSRPSTAASSGLTRTLVEELRPVRVNSIHPGVVGDSPYWSEKPAAIAKYTSETPTGRLARCTRSSTPRCSCSRTAAVNGVELIVDGGWHCR